LSRTDDWAKAYIRQADADLKAWESYEAHPEALVAECHRSYAVDGICPLHVRHFGLKMGKMAFARQAV